MSLSISTNELVDKVQINFDSGGLWVLNITLAIIMYGVALGITINDFNGDNLPDIYIANDFLSDDLMYINNGSVQEDEQHHLGFSEVSKSALKHTSYNAMGVDVADVNGDALPDIFVLDMLPEYNERQKTMLGFMNYNKYLLALRQGYSPQYIRNTLQLHNGFFNGEIGTGNIGTFFSQCHKQTRARIGCPADNLQRANIGFHLADL